MTHMVYIGHSKFGLNNRISLVEGLPEVMNLEVGDYVEFHIEDGKLILKKETVKYSGYDFEGQEIMENLYKMEQDRLERLDAGDEADRTEEAARARYEKDKAMRKKK